MASQTTATATTITTSPMEMETLTASNADGGISSVATVVGDGKRKRKDSITTKTLILSTCSEQIHQTELSDSEKLRAQEEFKRMMSSREDFYVVFGDKIDTFRRSTEHIDHIGQLSKHTSERIRSEAGHSSPTLQPYVPLGTPRDINELMRETTQQIRQQRKNKRGDQYKSPDKSGTSSPEHDTSNNNNSSSSTTTSERRSHGQNNNNNMNGYNSDVASDEETTGLNSSSSSSSSSARQQGNGNGGADDNEAQSEEDKHMTQFEKREQEIRRKLEQTFSNQAILMRRRARSLMAMSLQPAALHSDHNFNALGSPTSPTRSDSDDSFSDTDSHFSGGSSGSHSPASGSPNMLKEIFKKRPMGPHEVLDLRSITYNNNNKGPTTSPDHSSNLLYRSHSSSSMISSTSSSPTASMSPIRSYHFDVVNRKRAGSLSSLTSSPPSPVLISTSPPPPSTHGGSTTRSTNSIMSSMSSLSGSSEMLHLPPIKVKAIEDNTNHISKNRRRPPPVLIQRSVS